MTADQDTPPPDPAPPPIGFAGDQEVRIGLVMYGGVSLAVYINGVAQELLALVRATAPAIDPVSGEPTDRLHLSDAELTPVERVYREVGQVLGHDGVDVSVAPVRSRIIVDIIAGSSAGGINGIYLAKALANQQDIRPLKALWVDQAGIGNILNDRRGRKPLTGLHGRIPQTEPVEGLFSGDVMYAQLLGALERMDGPDAASGAEAAGSDVPPSPFVRDLDLWITATDLAGVALPLRLEGEEIYETQHRHTFHFVFGEAQVDGRVNDFARAMNPILAFAARATSSFPFAFTPARLADIGRVRGADGRLLVPKADRWRKWFGNHLQFADPGYEEVAFGDGGDIDNKPFSWVTDTLAARTSTTPVDRRIFYVEPDPGDSTPANRAAPKPDVIGSTIAAVSLGRVENIREDIERLSRRSASAQQIKYAVDAVQRLYVTRQTSQALATPAAEWFTESPDAMADRGLPYAAYYDLRVKALVSEFARSMAQVPWHAADTSASRAAQRLVTRWVADAYESPYVVADTDETPTTKRFLRDFDIGFRIRRLAFVASRADLLAADPPGQLALDQVDAFRAEIHRIKTVLGSTEEALRRFVPSLRSARDTSPPVHTGDEAQDSFELTPDEQQKLLSGEPDALTPARSQQFERFCAGVAAALALRVFPLVKEATTAAFDPDGGDPTSAEAMARDRVRNYHDRYADFDQVTFPAQTVAGLTGEIDPVKVHRISPRDTSNLEKPAEALAATGDERPSKVAGARFGHFGGFLDASWRANDIMWGRLDAAERLLSQLLGDHPGKQGLIDRAQDAILQDEGRYSPEQAALVERRERLDAFRDSYQVPDWPPTKTLLSLGGRSAEVANKMSEDLAGVPGRSMIHKVTGVVGWVLTALASVWFPDRLRRAFFRTIAAAMAVVGILLALAAAPLGWDSGASTGATLIVVGLALLVLTLFARLAWSRPSRLAWAPLLVAIPLMIYGGRQFWLNVLSQHWPFG